MTPMEIATLVQAALALAAQLQAAYAASKATTDATPAQLADADAMVDAAHARVQKALATGDPGA